MTGIFDSGVGGLTVVRSIKKKFKNFPIIYVGDTARTPWGNKSPEIIQKYSAQISEFLIKKGASRIIIACNTASTFAGGFLRKKYPEIEFLDVIEPVIERIKKEQITQKKFLSIGVIGTRGTINSGVYRHKILQALKSVSIYSQACPLFVPIAEEGLGSHPGTELFAKKYLKKIKGKINFLVLGCTHYPLLTKAIEKVMGNKVELISCADELADILKTKGYAKDKVFNQKDLYYFTDSSTHYKKLAKNILQSEIKIENLKV
ncbi:MAG: glutamate racemase [Candidatus Moranbacteria bacterium]|nr:glutamate racemase [Candidatus Moranbacteria bacterium]